MPLFRKSPAKVAGRRATRAWQTILDQTGEDLETLTGLERYEHAQEEARKWLRSYYAIPRLPRTPQLITSSPDPAANWALPEQRYHQVFLDYVEAFLAAFPPRIRGYP